MKKLMLPSALLVAALAGTASLLITWRMSAQAASASEAAQAEPAEAVVAATAEAREHRDATTAIGTVLATRSVTLRNEVAGTVREVNLRPGAIVEPGTLLVALDVAVEQAELKAQQAQLALAEATLQRQERLASLEAASRLDADRARAERDVAQAQIARLQAVIARKTLRVPFRARIGLADVHPGQYLEAGTAITTLQGVGEALHVDFAVPQAVAAGLAPGDTVQVFAGSDPGGAALAAQVVALDAKVDERTRNATVRARLQRATGNGALPAPGSSVRVSVAVGPTTPAVAVPAAALRKGPEGDHVFVVATAPDQKLRAQQRPVQVLALVGDEVLLARGVRAGEKVATSGSFKLRDAALVQLSAPAAPANRS
jgi:membrane fusion protein, multidrug efflux system